VGQVVEVPLHRLAGQFPMAPAAAGPQVPVLQETHSPKHEVLQHTPSTQFPERHWIPPRHPEPSGSFRRHTPPSQ
jgi:hypothetical protein